MSVNISLIVLKKKMYADFCYPDPDPANQNETDPDPQHCNKHYVNQ